jgi:hypothetical protein
MKRISIILFLFFYLISDNCVAQNIVVDIYPTNYISASDISFFEKLEKALQKKMFGRKNISLRINNSYNSNYKPRKLSEIKVNQSQQVFPNSNYLDKNSLYKSIAKIPCDLQISYSENFDYFDDFKKAYDIKSLKKEIQNEKEGKVLVLYDNGFIPYICDKERFIKAYNSALKNNNIDDFKVKVYKNKDGQPFRPVGDFYIIPFDSVGYFCQYEVDIYRNVNGEKIQLFNNIVDIKESYNSTLDYFIICPDNDYENSNLYLSKRILGLECMKQFDSKIGEIPDPTCPCNQDCLYNKNFNIRIRGIQSGDKDRDTWSAVLPKILLQCEKNASNSTAE